MFQPIADLIGCGMTFYMAINVISGSSPELVREVMTFFLKCALTLQRVNLISSSTNLTHILAMERTVDEQSLCYKALFLV